MTEDQLIAFLPQLEMPEAWVAAFDPACDRFDITSPARLAAFLAQVAEESSEFTRLIENLSYSAKRLTEVWPKRFETLKAAQPYARQPEKLANYVYAKRLGNGDTASGDGWRFRGRGLLQITGRDNYRACGKGLGLDLEVTPELLETPDVATLAAAQFWQSHGLNELADLGSDEAFTQLTVKINGGVTGLDARREYWTRARQALA